MPVDDAAYQLVDGTGIADVARDRVAGRVAAADDDICAGIPERVGDALPDATGAAGDEDDEAVQAGVRSSDA